MSSGLPSGLPGMSLGPPQEEFLDVTTRVNITLTSRNVTAFDDQGAFVAAWLAAASMATDVRVLHWAVRALGFLERFRSDDKAFAGWADNVLAALDARSEPLPREVIVAIRPFVRGKHKSTRLLAVRLLAKQRHSQVAFRAVRSASATDGDGDVVATAMRAAAAFHTFPRELMLRIEKNAERAWAGKYGDGYAQVCIAAVEAAVEVVFNLAPIDQVHASELQSRAHALAMDLAEDENEGVRHVAEAACRRFCPEGDFAW